MKEQLQSFLENTEKRIVFWSSKEFFSLVGRTSKFSFEDLEVMSYLLNREITDVKEGLRLIANEKLSYCYNHVEKKIPYVLTDMERSGILVSIERLYELENEVKQSLQIVTGEIKEIAGEDFNINSPKQLGEILFNKLGLRAIKKTASGDFSTNNDVLEELALGGSEIASKLMEARHLTKLLNTYISVLIEKSKSSPDGRIRSTFSSTSTLTGRLNSKNPNLQNLPTKTEIGTKIKRCFVAEEGSKLLTFDYSQIELRILAHIAGVVPLQEAFLKNEDIHARTASTMFEIPLESVTKTLRNNAKAINFGIIYGLSPFALGKTLAVTTSKANEYMNAYFEKYTGIREYMKEVEEIAKKEGFVRTILGKKCYIGDINSSNFTVRSHAIRAAINARIQGSAADLIKKAMIDLVNLDEDCKLILQIHDELVFEVKNECLVEMKTKIKQIMESAIHLSVPIVVNCKNFGDE